VHVKNEYDQTNYNFDANILKNQDTSSAHMA